MREGILGNQSLYWVWVVCRSIKDGGLKLVVHCLARDLME